LQRPKEKESRQATIYKKLLRDENITKNYDKVGFMCDTVILNWLLRHTADRGFQSKHINMVKSVLL